uniref:Uncharacterized protein n=1 Tax=Candidatus Methanophaga sp. ANME-1 ERB7 TaxID=2759913 RepID=A0A7G9Z7U8_9EURY|nr:hypothetical protein CHKFHCLN_00006 [Methanosarcinales archaeon ANME-1 ERB7]
MLNKRWNSKTRNDEESIICKLEQYARFYISIYHLILSNYLVSVEDEYSPVDEKKRMNTAKEEVQMLD